MGKEAPILQTFDAGELSPLLAARTDLAKYPNGCSVLENFLPLVQGPAVRRGGTQYIDTVKGRSLLVTFQVSEHIGYMMVFSHQRIDVYANHGILIDGGVPVVISTPYDVNDLFHEDGTCALRVVQSVDVMYLFHRKYPLHKLIRTGATTFTLQVVELSGGPFDNMNANEAITVSASAALGTVTLTASHNIFTPDHVGNLFHLESQDATGIKPWAVYQEVAVGDMRRVERRVYECTATGPANSEGPPVTGNQTPVHTEGEAWDGDGKPIVNDSRGCIGVKWKFLHAGLGIVRIIGFISATQVQVAVISRLPVDVVQDNPDFKASSKWAHSLFSSVNGWPEHGTFWRNRLVLIKDRRIAMSVSGDFENFAERVNGQVQTDAAIVQTLNARQLNPVRWVTASDELILGTEGEEWVIAPMQPNQAVGPDNVLAERRTTYGSRAVQPVEIGGKILFVQNSGRVLRDYEFRFESDNYGSGEITKLNPQILSSGVVDMAYQRDPDNTIWAVRADGLLVGCTYDQEPQRSDVYAWHRHPMTNGFVEAVQTCSAPDGAADDVWLIVRRTIDGQTVRYLEILRRPLADDMPQEEAFYVDSGLTYRGDPVSAISGLEHLNGQTVQILADGAMHHDRVVQDGKVALDWSASVVHVGLPAPCAVSSMGIEAGSRNGTAQGKLKRLTNVICRVYRTLGGNLGASRQNVQALNFRNSSHPMDAPPELFTGDMQVAWPGGSERDARIWYTNDQPLPVTLLAFMPIVNTQDDR